MNYHEALDGFNNLNIVVFGHIFASEFTAYTPKYTVYRFSVKNNFENL